MKNERDRELGTALGRLDVPAHREGFFESVWEGADGETRAKPAGLHLPRLSPRLRRRWGRRTLLVVLGAVVLLGTGTAFGARLVVNLIRPADTIAFTKVMPNGKQEIYLVRSDGSGLTRLTHTQGRGAERAAWSPDGVKIAFVSGGSVWVVNADGSEQRQVDPDGYGAQGEVKGVDWSPDGRRLVLALGSPDDRHDRLAIVNADGSDFRTLISLEGQLPTSVRPVWAPEGGIFFANRSSKQGVAAISSIEADGSGLTDVSVAPAGSDGDFSLSRDGRCLAIFDPTEGLAVLMASDGPGEESVFLEARQMAKVGERGAFGDLDGVASSWSPDGERIAFAGNGARASNATDLYVVGIDGSGLMKVPNTGPAYDPAWRPR